MSRQPFFGPNAKPFFIQLAVMIIVAATIAPFAGKFVAGLGCTYLGFCSTEQRQQMNASERR